MGYVHGVCRLGSGADGITHLTPVPPTTFTDLGPLSFTLCRSSMQSVDKDRDTLEKQLEKKEAELAGLTRSKEQLENRQRLLDKAAAYEKVVKSLKFNKIQRAAARVKAEKEELDRQLKEVQKAQEPFQRRVQACKQGATAAGTAVTRSQGAFAGAKEAVAAASEEVEGERHDDLQSAKNELSSVARERERLERKREETQRQLEAAIRVRDGVNVEELKERSAATQDRLRRAKAEHDAQREALAEARHAQQDAKAEVEEAEAKLRNLQDSKKQRLRKLQSNNSPKFSQAPDAVKAYIWIQQNRAQFRGRVFGPVALEVSVESQEHASIVEHHLPAHLLLGTDVCMMLWSGVGRHWWGGACWWWVGWARCPGLIDGVCLICMYSRVQAAPLNAPTPTHLHTHSRLHPHPYAQGSLWRTGTTST